MSYTSMWGIFRDGINIASFSKKTEAYRYGISKGYFVKDPRKLHSGFWKEGFELKEITD